MKMFLILLLAMVAPGTADSGATEPTRDRAFWEAIVAADYQVPEGESPLRLIRDLSKLLASPDSQLRDGFGYSIAARWIYVQELFSPEELHQIADLWMANLRAGIGETGTDQVLLRSFSALDLSILAALDNKSPFLDEEGFRRLLGAALDYMNDERDVRGYLPNKGWLHSPAHTADLLKFLGRNRHLRRAEQARILQAIGAKLDAPGGVVYMHGEDERMARAVLSILHREDLEQAAFQGWLEDLGSRSEGLWEGELDTRQFAAVQNTKNLLKSLYLFSIADEEEARVSRLQPVREAILKTLDRL